MGKEHGTELHSVHDKKKEEEEKKKNHETGKGNNEGTGSGGQAALAGNGDKGSNDNYGVVPPAKDDNDADQIYSNDGLNVKGKGSDNDYDQPGDKLDGGDSDQDNPDYDLMPVGPAHTDEDDVPLATHTQTAATVVKVNGPAVVPKASNSTNTEHGAEALCNLCGIRWTKGRTAALTFVVLLVAAAAAGGGIAASNTPGKRKPRLKPGKLDVNAGDSVSIDLNDYVEDTLGDAKARFTIVRQPANGSLTGTAPDLTYSPSKGFSGSDNFTFKITAGGEDSDAVTLTLNVLAARQPQPSPTVYKAQDLDRSVRSGESIDVRLSVLPLPMSSQTVVYKLNTQPGGTLSGTAPKLTYQAPDQQGEDQFTYQATVDGKDAGTAIARFTILPPLPAFDWHSVTDGTKLLAQYAACIRALAAKDDTAFWKALVGEVSQGSLQCDSKNTAGMKVNRMPYDVQQMVLQVLSELLASQGGFPRDGEKNYLGARALEQRLVNATGLPYRLKDAHKGKRPDPLPFYEAAQKMKLDDGSPAPRYYQMYALYLMLRIYTLDSNL